MANVQGFRYGLVNRPAGIGCVPNEIHRIEPPLECDEGRYLSRHGVIVFERPLTESELCSFELSVIADEDLKEELAIQIALKMERYAQAYLDDAEEDPSGFSLRVMDKLRCLRPYRVYVGKHDCFVEMVKSRLKNMVVSALHR